MFYFYYHTRLPQKEGFGSWGLSMWGLASAELAYQVFCHNRGNIF
jgi:hypothetical protein